MTATCEVPYVDWQPDIGVVDQVRWVQALELGGILFFPQLAFRFEENEQRLLSLAPTKAKNISFNVLRDKLGGFEGKADDVLALKTFMQRYVTLSMQLISRLFPQYATSMEVGLTSLRTVEARGRHADSFRKDDSRLHIDAFPSRPVAGKRLLRVFCNINPADVNRVWKVGESFEGVARTFLPKTRSYSPLLAHLRNVIGLTKSLQTPYDNIMLQLHHLMKADVDYQQNVAQSVCKFPPGSVWVVFSDQVSHAVLSGQHMMEQTFYLQVEAMYEPLHSPLKVLERLTGKVLV